MPAFEVTHTVENQYGSIMSAVLEEIERYKRGLPGFLNELQYEDPPMLQIIGLNYFRRRDDRKSTAIDVPEFHR